MPTVYRKSGWSIQRSNDNSKIFVEFYFNKSTGSIYIESNKITVIRIFEVEIGKKLDRILFGKCSNCYSITIDKNGKIQALSSPFCPNITLKYLIIGNLYESNLLDEIGKKFMINEFNRAFMNSISLPDEFQEYLSMAAKIVKDFQVKEQKLPKDFYFWKAVLYFSVIYSKILRRINIFGIVVSIAFRGPNKNK